MKLNKLEKGMIVGVILRVLRSKKNIKKHVDLERLPALIKVLDELHVNTTFEEREEAITSLINKLMGDLSEEDKG
ncbi:hypothetical protein [Bacillus wiedmannii]|uniref:hypothetical protein n=1 Tax=Bacillus wiedmannii TaxID=1890302 RepID=UPI002E219BF4|nr:hypothetical protein [Bacillus wiedmannii]